ncbi:MAG: carboxypeptidase-like regulatory domain-containing protein, partial [Edaphobacter sp.]
MTIRNLRLSIFAIVFLCFSLATAHAQSGQADVQGTVTDPTGSVIAKATVVLTNTASGNKRTVTTGSDGRYTFPTIAPGTYSITVTAASFSTATVSGLVINLDTHPIRDVTLHAGSTAEDITVTGTASAVDTTAYDVGGVVQQNQIENLPIPNRQYLALALLTPGTTQAATRTFYSNVQSGGGLYFYANGFYWDGVSNQQTEEGDPRQNIPEDAVAEFKTYTASMPAELGWAMGGFTTVVSKSGTNKIHGDVFEYYRGK